MTATATKPRKLTSPRYPGWAIERLGPTDYLMTRDAGIYAISVRLGKFDSWEGELMTCRKGVWGSYTAPWRHCVMGCVVEAERRATAIRKFEQRTIGPRKLMVR
jgi:hypothetical protein